MARSPPITASEREEIRRWWPRTDDPELRARQKHIARVLLELFPELRQELWEEDWLKGRLEGARAALRRVFARRGLALSTEEDARIEACADLAILERWHGEAIVASSAAEALR